ncbi:hypothetical protein Sden_2209 [Shewanella denitrificans OS217]|uniref:Uncharacterized protein n=1 Tax=Shewanella denitrificans (strain OS217 / ATCC BAA-1090 / DSM 15013) TaxID=318161 RepID=Q12M36_SHEDO|nr:DUF5694 domain-containing protein [Shewanella denitrificans]ABE55490.1 hypothetical protein Sden_2209 [Shewanella denitrificans OS217]
MKLKIGIFSVIFFISNVAFAGKESTYLQNISHLQSKAKAQTQVMVLGSTHLNSIKGKLDESALSPIIQMLASFKPTAIGIESLRAEDIIAMLNGSDEYQAVLAQFVGDTLLSLAKKEQENLGITAKVAIAKLKVLLDVPMLTTEQRIEVIRFAIAGYNKDTAVLHWRYLNSHSSIETISPGLKAYLDASARSNNEINTIATALALTLNINRLYPIDDHLDKDMYSNMVEKLMDSYNESKAFKAFSTSEYINKPERLKAQGVETGDWLPLFSWTNSDEYMSDVIDKEWRLFVDEDIDVEAGLSRIALWEVRNLNMVSNIMRVVADHVGEKVIIVVGSNHKVFLEQYLSNMIGVNIVQFNDILSNKNNITTSKL